jgi:hypothetical protein
MIEDELLRVSNMDEHQILLKARNHKMYKHQNIHDYNKLGKAIEDRLQHFGYNLEPACCGRFNIVKTNGDNINVRKPE